MPYKLIQNQIGGGSVEVLLLIGVLVAVYFLLVQTNLPKTVMKMVGMEKFNPNSSSVSSSQELTTTDELNRKSRPAVDLSSPGVPYQLPPARLGYSLSSDSQITPKTVAKSVAKTVAKTVAKVTTPVSTPASTPASTPITPAIASIGSSPITPIHYDDVIVETSN